VTAPNEPAPAPRRADLTAAPRPQPATYPWHTAPEPRQLAAAERPHVDGLRAGIVTRAFANSIDVVVVLVLVAGGYLGVAAVKYLAAPRSFRFPAPGIAFALLVICTVQGIYFTLAWALGGRTYGDQILGIRVVGWRGRKLRLVAALVRAVLCVIVPIGLLWVAVSRRNRSLQDILLRTSVVYDWSPAPAVAPGRTPS
jgi:uncharacterized RDD family membrane protein YckC